MQSRLPSLEDLTCGNTAGIRPKAITRAQLMTARPLQQVLSSPCDGVTHSCCLPARVPLEKNFRVACTGRVAAGWREGRGETIRSGQMSGQGAVPLGAHRAEVQWAKHA